MRGKLVSCPFLPPKYRITPAYAGKTSDLCVAPQNGQDHPRVCGENASADNRIVLSKGSPPRMRGKLTIGFVFVWWGGITPAYAGKTKTPYRRAGTERDHPRVCGENSVIIRPCRLFPRITPAYAGKTQTRNIITGIDRDHPRVCGENVLVGFSHCDETGSPPRMRGKRQFRLLFDSVQRITPAYAGKTVPPQRQRQHWRDHPRVCGENSISHARSSALPGSPPRMRGKLTDHLEIVIVTRITPAYAGKTQPKPA